MKSEKPSRTCSAGLAAPRGSFVARAFAAAPAGMLAALLYSLSACLLSACGQDPPAEPLLAPYHPLVPGSWWEYAHSDWTERVDLGAATFNGAPAFNMSDSPNPRDNLRSDSILIESDGRISRMTKEEYLVTGGDAALRSSVSYGVGFTRFDEHWAEQAVGFKETPVYFRIETPAAGTPRPEEERKHTFELISLSEEVRSPAGTFDCLVIRRTKDWEAEAEGVEDAQTKMFWFARGVGKVQELNEETGSTELLTAFGIPKPAAPSPAPSSGY
jgi:hypothetical protein